MKNRIVIIILLVSALAVSNTTAQSDEVLVPYNPTSMTKGLVINIKVGNIEIKGTDREDILVRYAFANQRQVKQEAIPSDGLKRIAISQSRLEIQAYEDRIEIRDSDVANELELYVEVPMNININSYKGGPGDLSINNITGNLNLENNSGAIVATSIVGIVNASTNEGGIKVGFYQLPEEFSMILANVMGDVEIDIPKEADVSFHMKTNKGELLTNLDLQMKEAAASPSENSSAREGFSYSNSPWSDAALNSGGPKMTLSSMTGNIIIKGH